MQNFKIAETTKPILGLIISQFYSILSFCIKVVPLHSYFPFVGIVKTPLECIVVVRDQNYKITGVMLPIILTLFKLVLLEYQYMRRNYQFCNPQSLNLKCQKSFVSSGMTSRKISKVHLET